MRKPDETRRSIRVGTLQWNVIEALPRSVRPGNDQSGYMCFCPYCLAEWEDPWFRKYWRTGFAEICTRHGCRMLVACVCGKAVRPHLSRDARSQAFCYACGQDYRKQEAKPPAYLTQMRYQQELDQRIFAGVESILAKPDRHSLIVELIRKPTDHGVMDLRRHPTSMPLRKRGLIDAYSPNSALSLCLIYTDVRRRTAPLRCGAL